MPEIDEIRMRLSDIAFDDDGVSTPVKMLRGVIFNGVLQDTFTFREMSGEDVEAINNSSVRANNAKIIQCLLERCLKSIGTYTRKELDLRAWSDLIHSLYVGDQDYMILAIRSASLGNEFEISHECPNPDCKAKLKTFIDVDELNIEYFKGLDEIPFELSKGYKDPKGVVYKKGMLRLPTGFDREVLASSYRKNPGLAGNMMLTRLAKFTGENAPPMVEQIIRRLSLRDINHMNSLLKENEFGVDSKIDVTCTTCGEEFTGDMNGANFL